MQPLASPNQQMTIGEKGILASNLEPGPHLADLEAPALRPAKNSVKAEIGELDFLSRHRNSFCDHAVKTFGSD